MRRLCLAVLCALLALPASASAVVGGRSATQAYPYMVALEYDRPGGTTQFSAVCGASRIAADRILTAAHCVFDDLDDDGAYDEPIPAANMRFLIGTQRLDERQGAETIGAAEITPHEKYDPKGDGSYDVAIVRLTRAATKGGTIRLASPATEKPLWAPGKEAIVTGWGSAVFQDPGVTYTNQLQEITIPMRSDEECQTSYMGSLDTTTMVCAGELQGGEDSCQGDSGGPLVVPDASGVLAQAGVVSFGNGCGFPTQYGVYARVGDTVLHDWVKKRVPAAAADPPAGSGSGSGGGTGTGTGTGGGTDTGGGRSGGGGGGTSETSTPTRPGGSGSRTYQRCVQRAFRMRAGTARRRAVRRCQYAEQRRIAYRRCVRRGTAKSRCRAQRRAQARRHARLVRRIR